MKEWLWFIIGLTLICCESPDRRIELPEEVIPQWPQDSQLVQLLPAFQKVFRQRVSQDRIPGAAVVIVKGQEVVWQECFGFLDVNTKEPVKPTTLFRLASLSKAFAPVLVGQMVEEGQLAWDESIFSYCPDLPLMDSLAPQITLRHLLSQSAGFPHHTYSNLLNMDEPYSRIRPLLAEVALSHPPGSWYNYQNVIFGISQEIVERVSGQSYDSLLQERVLDPLGMTHASSGPPTDSLLTGWALPHRPDSGGFHRIPFSSKYYTVSPAAGVNASITDMGKWLKALLGANPGVLSDSLRAELFRIQIPFVGYEPSVKEWRPYEQAGYGLGWRIIHRQNEVVVAHTGYVNGYRAAIVLCPAKNIGICLLSNGSSSWWQEVPVQFFSQYLGSWAVE